MGVGTYLGAEGIKEGSFRSHVSLSPLYACHLALTTMEVQGHLLLYIDYFPPEALHLEL